MAGAVACSSCSKQLSHGARHDLCWSCRYPPRPEKFCVDCGCKVNAKQNRSGRCRRCLLALNRVGEANERRIEALRRANEDPALRERRGNAVRAYCRTPEGRRQRIRTGKLLCHRTILSPLAQERAHAPEARKLAWETRRRQQAERIALVRFRQCDAADFLRSFAPVYRCDERGRPHERGAHWRYGAVVLTPDELLQRAARRGFSL